MEQESIIPRGVQEIIRFISKAPTPQLVRMVRNPFIRRIMAREVQKFMFRRLKESRSDPNQLPSIQDDRTAMGLAIIASLNRAFEGKRLSDSYLRGLLQVLIKTLFVDRGNPDQQAQFQEAFGKRAPTFLLISPGKACNLRCSGCYADSDTRKNTLEWSVVDRIITEAKELWGERFFVISGGEPFVYRSEGKGMMELFEKHNDSFFMVYTNGTLIDEKVSRRLSETGNVLLCISLEGFRELTDARRGAGVFDKIMAAMDQLRKDGVLFGVSLTGTRDNAEEILSDEFVDFIMEKGAIVAWLFQYMPIGRSYTLDLMVTPEQRAWMWKRSWDIVLQKRFFMADFWNHGTCVDGCLSAGGHGQGGYFYIDWNGAVTPCVFMPYSPVNIRDVFARGETLNDVWQHPFFAALRQWQYDYVSDRRNTIAPCPSRDHHDELERLLLEFEPEPTDANAAEALIDPEYTRGLVEYNRKFEALTKDIWETRYLNRQAGRDEMFVPLPDVPAPRRG